jgi:hypothetical protein
MKKIKAVFSNDFTSHTGIIDFDSSEYLSPMVINGVIIETDGFEALSIDNTEQYSEEQLKQFDYDIIFPYKDKTKKLFVLKNYNLQTYIPVSITKKETNKSETAELIIEMIHNGKNLTLSCSLLEEKSENFDSENLEIALNNLQEKSNYFINICACCKNSNWNPYGGMVFLNQLCFRNDSEKFQNMKLKTKYTVASIMKDDADRNFDLVWLTDNCKYYIPRE